MSFDIYLDMDGVCVQFVEGLAKTLGIEDRLDNWPAGVYDLTVALGISQPTIHSVLSDQSWWRELEPSPWFHDLLSLCTRFGHVSYASSPCDFAAAAAGKIEWVHKHFPTALILAADKSVLSRPGTVLIDDHIDQCAMFEVRRDAGSAILFPQKWNMLHALNSQRQKLDYIEEMLCINGLG